MGCTSSTLKRKFRKALLNGHTEIVRLLLSDRRVNPSAGDNEAIRLASTYGHTEVVRLLLSDRRVNPSAYNNSAIRMASIIFSRRINSFVGKK